MHRDATLYRPRCKARGIVIQINGLGWTPGTNWKKKTKNSQIHSEVPLGLSDSTLDFFQRPPNLSCSEVCSLGSCTGYIQEPVPRRAVPGTMLPPPRPCLSLLCLWPSSCSPSGGTLGRLPWLQSLWGTLQEGFKAP